MVLFDKRKTFIVSAACHFFGVPLDDKEIAEEKLALDKFLDESTCRTLCARPVGINEDNAWLELTNELQTGENTLVFYKISATEVTEENFHHLVQVTSTGDREGTALIEALRQVWAPTLQSFGLRTSFRKKLEKNLLGVLPLTSLHDEEIYWKKKYEEVKKSDEKLSCEEVIKTLRGIRLEFDNAAVSS
ncbi:hypothetical protein KM043_007921 [Ampulex compressa]|nr:hypothetical protein KM043_007921 [Ampulex compressa]